MARTPRLCIFDVDGTLRWTTMPGQKHPLASHEWRLMPNVAERLSAIPWSDTGPFLTVAPADALFVGDLAIDEEAARRAQVPFRWANDIFGW